MVFLIVSLYNLTHPEKNSSYLSLPPGCLQRAVAGPWHGQLILKATTPAMSQKSGLTNICVRKGQKIDGDSWMTWFQKSNCRFFSHAHTWLNPSIRLVPFFLTPTNVRLPAVLWSGACQASRCPRSCGSRRSPCCARAPSDGALTWPAFGREFRRNQADVLSPFWEGQACVHLEKLLHQLQEVMGSAPDMGLFNVRFACYASFLVVIGRGSVPREHGHFTCVFLRPAGLPQKCFFGHLESFLFGET